MAHDYELYNKYQNNKLKEDYIAKINNLLKQCDDISFLDLIKTLLDKKLFNESV